MANVITEEDTCPVCLKEFGDSKIGKLPCSHIFCYVCILEWSKVSSSTPLNIVINIVISEVISLCLSLLIFILTIRSGNCTTYSSLDQYCLQWCSQCKHK